MFSSIFALNDNKLSGSYCSSNIDICLKLSGKIILPSHHESSELVVKDFSVKMKD